jgi:hypothetical protein
MPAKAKHAGKRFGKLLVLNESPLNFTGRSGVNVVKWDCLCDCGNAVTVRSANLTKASDPTLSCGCLQKISATLAGVKKRLPAGNHATNSLFARYKRSARYRGRNFDLTLVEFRSLIESKCFYCNDEPKSRWRRKEAHSEKFYNGIDRVVNECGYETKNVVTCCEVCNTAKSCLSVEEFLSMIQKIHRKHLNEKN